jgi:hypothetical protein
VGIPASYRSTAPSDPVGVSAAELAHFPLVLGLDTFGDLTRDVDDRPLFATMARVGGSRNDRGRKALS